MCCRAVASKNTRKFPVRDSDTWRRIGMGLRMSWNRKNLIQEKRFARHGESKYRLQEVDRVRVLLRSDCKMSKLRSLGRPRITTPLLLRLYSGTGIGPDRRDSLETPSSLSFEI